jgi:hypothetical protein
VAGESLNLRPHDDGAGAVARWVPPSAASWSGGSSHPTMVATMVNHAAMFRIAVAVFDEPQRLEKAVAELFASGVTKESICLAGKRQAFEAARHCMTGRTAQDPIRTLLAGHLQRLGGLKEDLQLYATPGVLLRTLLAKRARPRAPSPLPSLAPSPVPPLVPPLAPPPADGWLIPELCMRLTDHLRAGAIVLLVSANSHARQHQWSRVLLNHASHPIQTHEFTPTR